MKPHLVILFSDGAVTAALVDAAQGVLRTARREAAMPETLFALHDAEALAACVRECVAEIEAEALAARLVIPLNWAFTHVLATAKRVAEEALAFEFEQFLPVPLEELTYTFIRREGTALGMAIPTEPMRRLLAAMEAKGIAVEHVHVDALALAMDAREKAESAVVLDESWARGILKGNGQFPTLFLAATPDHEGLGELLRSRGLDGALASGLMLLELRQETSEPECVREDIGAQRLGREAAMQRLVAAVLQADEQGDLRLGALAARGRWQCVRQRGQGALVCVMLLMLAVLVGLHVRARTLKEQLAALESAQLGVYREVFTVDELPPGAALRLASERKRLEGLTRPSVTTPQIESDAPLDTLRELVAVIPADVRIFLENLRLDESQLSLRGKTAEHRDAERIVEALGHLSGLEVRPPRTTRLNEGGVEFSIVGRRQEHE